MTAPNFTRDSTAKRADKSSLFLAALIVLLLVGGFVFYSRAQDEKTSTTKNETTAMSDEKPAFPEGAKPTDAELHAKLTPLQYKVTKESGTEPAFHNEYWDNHRAGIYVDRISGEALFSSLDKFESGTGWPSFTKPLSQENVVMKDDGSHGMERTEVRSHASDAHLGHLFDDGPAPTHQRYCLNSASLRFVPVDKLKEEGYGQYLPLFEVKK